MQEFISMATEFAQKTYAFSSFLVCDFRDGDLYLLQRRNE